MRLPGWLPALALCLAALGSGVALWVFYQSEKPVVLTGPPRSDYFLVDFELISLNDEGKEAFRVTGPHLSRHPELGTITIEQPRFRFPVKDADAWTARADSAWAAANANELRLQGDVVLDAPSEGSQDSMSFRSESLDIFPRERRASSDDLVVFDSARSILQGRGFRIDMQSQRYQLLSEVTGHYDTPVSTSRP